MNDEQKKQLMDKAKALAITGVALYLAYRFGGHQAIKAAALGAAGVMVVRQVPVIKNGMFA